jgi:hypothetical protein
MVVVPTINPDTTPEAPIVATAVSVLLHVPPAVGLARVMLLPAHTDEGPEIEPATGTVFTVTTAVIDVPNKV